MNMIERQMRLGRDLMELNVEWFRKFAEYDVENVRKFVEFNQEFAGRLPEVRDVQSFVELQREYGQQLWNGTQEAFQGRVEMMREAAEHTGETFRAAWNTEEGEAVEEAQQAA